MTKRNHSSALTGLVLGAFLMGLPAAVALARQEQSPAPDDSEQKQEQKQETNAQTASSTATPPDANPAPTAAATPMKHPPESTHPPRTGRFVGDHWTPYEPPGVESFPQGSQVHVIVKGDTLWDLAGKYLDNPFLWPQIWDVNQYITDSHWIYPGDPLLIPGKPTVIGEKGPEPAIEVLQPPAATPEGAPEAGTVAEPAPPAKLTPSGPVLAPIADETD